MPRTPLLPEATEQIAFELAATEMKTFAPAGIVASAFDAMLLADNVLPFFNDGAESTGLDIEFDCAAVAELDGITEVAAVELDGIPKFADAAAGVAIAPWLEDGVFVTGDGESDTGAGMIGAEDGEPDTGAGMFGAEAGMVGPGAGFA